MRGLEVESTVGAALIINLRTSLSAFLKRFGLLRGVRQSLKIFSIGQGEGWPTRGHQKHFKRSLHAS